MRIVDEEDQIVDALTGLIWQRSYKTDLTFDEALEYSTQLSKETGLDWRIPTIEELSSLINRSRVNPASEFPDMPSDRFWTSSPYVGSSNRAWYVGFYIGNVNINDRSSGNAVRLVRSR